MIKRVAETYAHRVWHDKDMGAIDDLIHSDCVIHSLLGDFRGPEAMKTVVQAWLKAFPDMQVKNTAVITEKDLVVIQWQARATHQGDFKGIAATKKSVAYAGVTIYRISRDQIVEYWAYIDMKHLLDQLV